jgi:dihydroorotate dehydrogenase
VLSHQFDGLIATNTTVARPDHLKSKNASQVGGLSGAPVRDKSTACIREFYRHLRGKVDIIGVGGIANADHAWEKLLAGASYLQVYSMFIYQGPGMVGNIVKGLKAKVEQHGFASLEEAMLALRE